MAYGVILSIACLILPIRFALVGGASPRSKGSVVGLALATFLIRWPIAAILAQLAVSLYVLLYFKAFPPGDRSGR